MNFWLSVFRKKESNHHFEGAGKIMCIVGYWIILFKILINLFRFSSFGYRNYSRGCQKVYKSIIIWTAYLDENHNWKYNSSILILYFSFWPP